MGKEVGGVGKGKGKGKSIQEGALPRVGHLSDVEMRIKEDHGEMKGRRGGGCE